LTVDIQLLQIETHIAAIFIGISLRSKLHQTDIHFIGHFLQGSFNRLDFGLPLSISIWPFLSLTRPVRRIIQNEDHVRQT